jgi:putative nucleotidyltransferase with HDIG domain
VFPSKKRKEANTSARTRRRQERPRLLEHTAIQATIVLLMGSALAFVMVYQPASPVISLDEFVVGEAAPRDVRATHPFAIVREDAADLERRRDLAETAVRPIWDFNAGLADDLVARVEGTFLRMRHHLNAAALARWDQAASQEGTGMALGTGEGLRPPEPDEILSLLSNVDRERVTLEHFASLYYEYGLDLNAEIVGALGRNGFSEPAQEGLVRLIRAVEERPLVNSREVLLAEQERGILLRTRQGERTVDEALRHDFSEFMNRSEAQSSLRDLADSIRPPDIDGITWQAVLNAAVDIVEQNVNTRFNLAETDARRLQARSEVRRDTQTVPIAEGQLIVHAGQVVTESDAEQLEILRSLGADTTEVHANELVIGGVIYVLLVLIGVITYGIRFIRRFNPTFKDLAFMTVTLLVMVSLTKLIMMFAVVMAEKAPGFPTAAIYAAIPFAAGAMLVRVVLNAESALIFTIAYSLLVALLLPEHPIFAAYSLLGSLVGTGAVEIVRTRMTLFRAGLLVGLLNVAFGLAYGLLDSALLTTSTLWLVCFCLVGGILVALLVSGLLPVVESTFSYISDIKLLELANPNHPALKELLLNAPGSYNHSMMVASLTQSACQAIGANSLLGRVGSYYHDIGKSNNPQYFAENQTSKNPHDKLKPHMSALIIKSHVKDGVEKAHGYGLPEEIIFFIREHHGTSLIKFFYHKAKELEDPEIQEVNEKEFRYPGPKPQTPETAVCLLADGIEAASRAMQEPTAARLQGLVQRMINGAFTDGQLDESDLTLRDLDAIAREFIRILASIYHQRPEYPDAKRDSNSKELRSPPEKEKANGSGDSAPVDGEGKPGEPGDPEGESPGTLKRLGIDQGRAVDPANRRQRD